MAVFFFVQQAVPFQKKIFLSIISYVRLCRLIFPSVFWLAGWSEPRIRLNSGAPVGTDVILDSGSPLHLICEGDGPVTWLPRLAKHKRLISKEVGNVRSFRVDRATAEFTGTYKCVYMNGNDSNESSSVHVFVRGEWTLSMISFLLLN